jgi:DNA-binding protein HU-beta
MAVKKAAKKAAPKAGSSMTQTQIITHLAEKSEVNKKVVKGLLDALGELAVAQTKKNGKFVYPGLGRLVKSQRKARMGRNPATGAAIKIPAKTVVKFRLSKAVSDQIVPPKPKK